MRPDDFEFQDQVFATLIPMAEAIQAKETQLLDGMTNGISLLEMTNFTEHCAKIQAGQESTLQFRVPSSE